MVLFSVTVYAIVPGFVGAGVGGECEDSSEAIFYIHGITYIV